MNQKLFRGYATTAAVREGHLDILEILLKAGASQEACEEALLEASYLGQARASEQIMSSEFIRPQLGVHALVSACCRGFVNVVDTLIKVPSIHFIKFVVTKFSSKMSVLKLTV